MADLQGTHGTPGINRRLCTWRTNTRRGAARASGCVGLRMGHICAKRAAVKSVHSCSCPGVPGLFEGGEGLWQPTRRRRGLLGRALCDNIDRSQPSREFSSSWWTPGDHCPNPHLYLFCETRSHDAAQVFLNSWHHSRLSLRSARIIDAHHHAQAWVLLTACYVFPDPVFFPLSAFT